VPATPVTLLPVKVVATNPVEAGGSSAPPTVVGKVSPAPPSGSGNPIVVAPASPRLTGGPPPAGVVSGPTAPVVAVPAATTRWGFIDFLLAPAVGAANDLPGSGDDNGRHAPGVPENATGGGMRSGADGSAFNPALVGRSAWHPELSPGNAVLLIDATRGGRSAEAAPLPG
jgi:hypothetical protein